MMILNVTTLSQGGVVFMLFLIYACHLPVSIEGTNFFKGMSCWWMCRVDVIHDLCESFPSN